MFLKLNVFETALIIGLGMFKHFYGFSIIELNYSKLPLLAPNAASSLFVLSILCMLSKIRTFWTQTSQMPQRFIIFLLELSLILYACDFILYQLWLPTLKLLNFLCHFLGQYVITSNQNFLIYKAPQLSKFIRNDGFYFMRFLLAAGIFVLMLNVTGCLKRLKQLILKAEENFKTVDLTKADNMYYEDYNVGNGTTLQNINTTRNLMPIDVYELPCVPPEDILNLSNRSVVSKQKKPRSLRKTKRKSRVLLDDDLDEYNC